MRSRRPSALLAAVLTSAALAQSPAQKREINTLYDVVASMPWDATKTGPLVAVSPLAAQTGRDLGDFGRRSTVVGGVTAVVPIRMTVVDSKFTQAANLYEGLPQQDKALYLLRSLDASQWAKAAADGISAADLRGEQVLVFDSLLPNPLRYSIGTVEDDDSVLGASDPKDRRALTAQERGRVRLRVVRHLEFTLPLRDEEGITGGSLPIGKKGEFGHAVLVDAPNAPKPSNLDLRDARLAGTVPLRTGESVAALLARISDATGLRVVADPHYADMRMFEAGGGAKARDLLGAVSLGVSGTYRRVADAYVLTNDLEGMAAHQARVAAWEDAVKKEIDVREKAWRAGIAQVGAIARVPFHDAAYEGLTDAERTNLEANDCPEVNGSPYIPVASASPAVRGVALRGAHGLETDKSRIAVHSSLQYEIVLPDGSASAWGGWLGQTDQFDGRPAAARQKHAAVALPLTPTARLQRLALHADTAAEGADRVAQAARLGIGSVWIETTNSEALASAIGAGTAKGVKVSLVVRPWTLGPGEPVDDSDRTATGAHGNTLAVQRAELGPWMEYWDGTTAFAPSTPERLDPTDPRVPSRIAKLARLAGAKGLASVVVRDLYGIGYARAAGNSYGSYYYTPPVEAYLSYGYSDRARSSFFRKEGVDPLDLENPMVRTEVDLRPAWGDAWGQGEEYGKWQAARGASAQAAALALGRALSASDLGRPVLMSPQAPTANIPPALLVRYVMAWKPSDEVPVAPIDFSGDATEEAAAYKILEIRDDTDLDFRARLASVLSRHLGAKGTPVVLDLTSVPSGRVDAVLTRWLRPGPPFTGRSGS